MAARQDPKDQLVAVPLFESAHRGFGDGREATPHRYNRVLRGFDSRVPAELRFGSYITRIASPVTHGEPPTYAVEWRHTDDATPCIYYVVGRDVVQIRNGAAAALAPSGSFLTAACTDAAIHDNGAGVSSLYFAEGSAANIQRMVIAQTLTTGNNARDKIASISGSLYASQAVSGGRWCLATFVPPGADPFTSANWSAGTLVGWPTTDINAIVQVRGFPVYLKPEGIFAYDQSIDLWVNKMPSWEWAAHPDNGRGAFSIGPAIVVPLGRGGAVIFDGYSVRDFHPWSPDGRPDLDTTQQSLSCIAPTPAGVAAITTVTRGPVGGRGNQVRHNRAFGTNYNSKIARRGGADAAGAAVLGPRFFRTQDNEVNFTNYTTQVSDGDYSTVAVLSSQDTAANGDYFYIGHLRPFQAVLLIIPAAQVNTNASVLTVEIWNGSAWVTITHFDFTDLQGATLDQSQMVMFTQDPINDLAWATRTIGTDGQSAYYARFSVSAALDASVQISQVFVLPWRPAIDDTNFPEDGMDRAGCFPHLLLGGPGEDGGGIWHDLGAIMTARTDVDEISCLLTAEVGGANSNSTNKLVAIGRRAIYFIEKGLGADNWPFVSPAGLIEFPFVRPLQGQVGRAREIRIEGRDFDGVTNCWFYWRYRANEQWSRKAVGSRLPAIIPLREEGGAGVEFQFAIGYTMSLDTTIRAPTITGVTGDFEIVAQPSEALPDRPIATPPRG